MRVNEIEAMYGRSLVSVKVETPSTLTFTRDLSHIASILFTREKFTCVGKRKLLEFSLFQKSASKKVARKPR